MAGYSGTPLPRKLGIKPGQRIALLDAPDTFLPSIEPLPPDITLLDRLDPPIDLAVAFADREDRLRAHFASLEPLLGPAGALWAAWPKKSSGRPTDLVRPRPGHRPRRRPRRRQGLRHRRDLVGAEVRPTNEE